MKLPSIISHNFSFDYFEKNKLPFLYKKINNVPENFFEQSPEQDKNLHIVNCVIPYIGKRLSIINSNYGCYTKSYRLGYAMDFSNYSNAADFLKDMLGKKPYKNLRQDRQRLHRDHNIQLKIYYGKIDNSYYTYLFDTLKDYILKRFEGRTKKHTALQKWDDYMTSSYNMILSKKAVLFVLYDDEKPIAISLSYLQQGVLNATITSFNDKYYRYSLGRLMFVNQIEWCFANDYKLLDTGWGNLDYKIKFCNAIFYYETKVFYPKKSILKKILAYLICNALMIKYYLVVLLKEKRFKKPEKKFANRWLNMPDSNATSQNFSLKTESS